MVRYTLGLVALAACGRVSFDPLTTTPSGDGAIGDSPPQAKCATTYASALLCEDFEVDLDKWFIDRDGSNRVVRDTTFARSGNASAHAIGREAGSARLIATPLANASSGTLYLRYYQWLPAGPTIQSIAILHVVSDVIPYPGIVLNINANRLVVQSTIDAMLGNDAVDTLPREAWTCVQETIMIASSGSVTTWIDGVAAATYSGNTVAPNGYRDVHVGAFLYQSTPLDMWIDDVVVNDAPVPCD